MELGVITCIYLQSIVRIEAVETSGRPGCENVLSQSVIPRGQTVLAQTVVSCPVGGFDQQMGVEPGSDEEIPELWPKLPPDVGELPN